MAFQELLTRAVRRKAPNKGGAVSPHTFAFWDINASPYATAAAPTFTVPQQDFSATAWYWPMTGGSGSIVNTQAFSLNKDQVIEGQTPIASVTGAPWTPPSTTVDTKGDTPVVITATRLIGGFGRFASWVVFGEGMTVNGPVLTVLANSGGQAIAFYGIPVPDPCASIRAEIAALQASVSGEIPVSKAVMEELDRLIQALIVCEQQYGELP